ncbi:MAG: class I SAM-dependent methyltransferase [Methylocella sp.]
MVLQHEHLPSAPEFVRKLWGSLARLVTPIEKSARRTVGPAFNERPINWKEIEYFDQTWINRVRKMAAYVPSKSRVLDLGCGEMCLREFLEECVYIPVDYKARSAETIVCDFNRYEFPDVQVDVAFVSGCLEYLENPLWFIEKIAAHSKICVISYCTIEHFDDPAQRATLGWKNGFGPKELISIFVANDMKLADETFLPDTKNTIFRFVA